MSQKPVTSWASLASFGGAIENVESAMNEGVGGAYFDVGTHKDVFIESMEPRVSKAGNAYISVSLQADNGASIRYNVMLNKKDGPGFHFTYNQLAAAICASPELRMKSFGRVFRDDPSKMECLRGARLTIEIAKGKEGYTIEKDAMDNCVVIDVETGVAPEGLEGQIFESYTDAKEAADALSLKRCYNEVKRVSKASPEFVTANESTLSEVVRAAESGAGPKAPTASRANKPRPTL
jgi:hypothetical protein